MRLSDALILEVVDSLHCEQGDHLLAAWNIPEIYRDVSRRHHDEKVETDDKLLLLLRVVDRACYRLGVGLGTADENEQRNESEALAIGATNVVLAELEIRLEDAARLAI
jgi:HD-like signal output (HDOD) protein